MVLPLPPDSVLVPPSSAVPSVSDNTKVNKAVLDNQVTQALIPRLPALLNRGYELAMTSESDSVSLDAVKYFIDRVAGKARENIKIDQTTTNIILTKEEIDSRLAALQQQPPNMI